MSFIASLANWDALLQEDYVQGQIMSAINIATPFRDKLKRVGMTSGRERVYGVKVGASQGQGARAEGATMPAYGAGEYQDCTLRAKYNYAPFKITGQAEEFGTRKAFVEFAMKILKDTKEGMKLFTGRQCWGDGQGILCLINGALGAGAVAAVVDSAYGVLWGSLATNTTFLVKRKMTVQFGTEDNSGQGYVVSGVTGTGFTFTPPLVNAVANDSTVTILGSGGLEIEGLLVGGATAAFMTTLGLASTVYHGINRTNFPEYEGNVVNIAAALALTNIRTVRDTIYKRTDDEESNLFICSTEIVRDYEALLQPGQRFVPATKLEGGHTIIEHDGLRISKDSKAPIKAFFLMDTKTIAWAQTRDPHWLQDGQGIMRVVPGQDAKEALLKWYANLDFEEPRRVGIGYNVTTT
jgi:hypothetical protein